MAMLICSECGRKCDTRDSRGLCLHCIEAEDLKKVIQTTLPEGFIGSWNDTPSYLNKKLGRRYFAIPDKQDDNILDGTKYKIIIMEI